MDRKIESHTSERLHMQGQMTPHRDEEPFHWDVEAGSFQSKEVSLES